MDKSTLLFNGIDAETGKYLLSGLDRDEVLAVLHQRPAAPARAPRYGIDAANLAEAGWGVIFPAAASPALIEALSPLLELRREQASRREERYFRFFAGDDGYRPGETAENFLSRWGVGPGAADPRRMPYYLLLVGSPEEIPFSFQYQLDVQYAVGRLAFETVEEYASYATTVLAAEAGEIHLPRRAALFGVANPDDQATALSAEHFIQPMSRHLEQRIAGAGKAGSPLADWHLDCLAGEEATKARLGRLLGGEETPALLLTTSHGMGFRAGHPRQRQAQGALLCQDWPGPVAWKDKPIPPEHYFAGDDVAATACPRGLISFCFACFGAGTPELDDFAHRDSLRRPQPARLAPQPFLAGLPQRLLGHPRGGGLAWIGHVERAWGYSFFWHHLEEQIQPFEDAFEQLMAGHPVGAAMEFFSQRYAELATRLAEIIRRRDYGENINADEIRYLWTAHNDARSYIIIGDPAVRLAVQPADSSREA